MRFSGKLLATHLRYTCRDLFLPAPTKKWRETAEICHFWWKRQRKRTCGTSSSEMADLDTTEEGLDPDLDVRTLSTNAAVAARERARVRAGQLNGMGRLVLFSPLIHPNDTCNWTVVPVALLEYLPAGVEHYAKLDYRARCERGTISYKHTFGRTAWNSYIFGRVEAGKSGTSILQVRRTLLATLTYRCSCRGSGGRPRPACQVLLQVHQ